MTEKSTEAQILQAAKRIFEKKGYSGARMQEIANEAGINKGLLHYYFKSKDRLFHRVFGLAFENLHQNFRVALEADLPPLERLDVIVDAYLKMMSEDRHLAPFVLNELNRDPERFVKEHLTDEAMGNFSQLQLALLQDMEQGKLKWVDPRQLVMDLVSLVLFPYVSRPLLRGMLGLDDEAFSESLEQRGSYLKKAIRERLEIT